MDRRRSPRKPKRRMRSNFKQLKYEKGKTIERRENHEGQCLKIKKQIGVNSEIEFEVPTQKLISERLWLSGRFLELPTVFVKREHHQSSCLSWWHFIFRNFNNKSNFFSSNFMLIFNFVFEIWGFNHFLFLKKYIFSGNALFWIN